MPSLLFTFSIYVAFHYRRDGNWIALAGVRFTCNKMSDPTMLRLCYWVLISTNQCESGIQIYLYALSEKKSFTNVNTAAAPIQSKHLKGRSGPPVSDGHVFGPRRSVGPPRE